MELFWRVRRFRLSALTPLSRPEVGAEAKPEAFELFGVGCFGLGDEEVARCPVSDLSIWG